MVTKTQGLSSRRRKKLEENGQTSLGINISGKSARAELVDVQKKVAIHRLDTYSKFPKTPTDLFVVLNPALDHGNGTKGGEGSFHGTMTSVQFDPSIGFFCIVIPNEDDISPSLKKWLPKLVRCKLSELRRIKK